MQEMGSGQENSEDEDDQQENLSDNESFAEVDELEGQYNLSTDINGTECSIKMMERTILSSFQNLRRKTQNSTSICKKTTGNFSISTLREVAMMTLTMMKRQMNLWRKNPRPSSRNKCYKSGRSPF